MTWGWQILAAVALDLLIGDPRWLPHPVRAIGRMAEWLEPRLRRLILWEKAAGVCAVMMVVGTAGSVVWVAIRVAGWIHSLAADMVSIIVIYTTIAARDLAAHSMAVFSALKASDLEEARRRVGMIVGRDTAQLDEAGVTRAAVECIAENTVDGVTAPLFFAIIAGPVGAMIYRAINTLDSTFGYKTERYLRFGWASARLDDLATYLPARITAPLIGLAAIFGQRPLNSWRILLRDGRKHESPNSGLPEAAMAGALGVQVGGLNFYDGEPLAKPTIGDAEVPLAPSHIPAANTLMFVTVGLFLFLCLIVRSGVVLLMSGRVW